MYLRNYMNYNEQKFPIKAPKMPVIVRQTFDMSVLEQEDRYEKRKEHKGSTLITELVDHWIELGRIYFGISRYKVTKEEKYMLYNLIRAGIDEHEIKVSMGAMMYEYRFVDWFRARDLIPQVSTFVKKINKYLSRVRKFENTVQRNKKVDMLISFLELNPLVDVDGERIPFGFKIPESIRISDVVKISGRTFWYVSDDGVKRSGSAYCHYIYEQDVISKGLRFASDGVILYVNNENMQQYIDRWGEDLSLKRPTVREIAENIRCGLLRIGEIPVFLRKDVREKL